MVPGLRHLLPLPSLTVYTARTKWFHWHRLVVIAACPHFYTVVTFLLALPSLVWLEKPAQTTLRRLDLLPVVLWLLLVGAVTAWAK